VQKHARGARRHAARSVVANKSTTSSQKEEGGMSVGLARGKGAGRPHARRGRGCIVGLRECVSESRNLNFLVTLEPGKEMGNVTARQNPQSVLKQTNPMWSNNARAALQYMHTRLSCALRAHLDHSNTAAGGHFIAGTAAPHLAD
jgi:hypothetical protein